MRLNLLSHLVQNQSCMNEFPQHNTQTPENDKQKVWHVLEDVDVGEDPHHSRNKTNS